MGKKKKNWISSSVFLIPLEDGSYGLGQVLKGGKDVIICAFFDLRLADRPKDVPSITDSNIISVLEVSTNHLDDGDWVVIENSVPDENHQDYIENKYFNKSYISIKSYSSVIADDLVNAYFGIIPWDDYVPEDYLDSLLVKGKKRPANVKLIK